MVSPLYVVVDVAGFALLFAGVASLVKATRTLRPWPSLFEVFVADSKKWSEFVDFLYPWHQLRLPMKRGRWSALEAMKVRWQLHQIKPWCMGWSALSVFCALLLYVAPTVQDSDSMAFGSLLVWLHTAGLWLAYSKRVV